MYCPRGHAWGGDSSKACVRRERVCSDKVWRFLHFPQWRWRDDSDLSRAEYVELFTELYMWVELITDNIKGRATSCECLTLWCADPESQRRVSGVVSVVGWSYSDRGQLLAESEFLVFVEIGAVRKLVGKIHSGSAFWMSFCWWSLITIWTEVVPPSMWLLVLMVFVFMCLKRVVSTSACSL